MGHSRTRTEHPCGCRVHRAGTDLIGKLQKRPDESPSYKSLTTGSPRGTERCPARARRSDRLYCTRGSRNPMTISSPLTGEVRLCRDSEVIGDEGEGEKGTRGRQGSGKMGSLKMRQA